MHRQVTFHTRGKVILLSFRSVTSARHWYSSCDVNGNDWQNATQIDIHLHPCLRLCTDKHDFSHSHLGVHSLIYGCPFSEIRIGVNVKQFLLMGSWEPGKKGNFARRNLKLCVMRWKFLSCPPSKLQRWMVIYLFITCFMEHQQKVENFIPMINEALLMLCKFLSLPHFVISHLL